MAKRINASGNLTELEQENLRLRSRICDLERGSSKIEDTSIQTTAKLDRGKKTNPGTSEISRVSICPSLVLEQNNVCTISTRRTKRGSSEVNTTRTQILSQDREISNESLLKYIDYKFKQLKEEVFGLVNPRKKRNEKTQRDT